MTGAAAGCWRRLMRSSSRVLAGCWRPPWRSKWTPISGSCDASVGVIESTNTKIRLITRVAFEFHGPDPLIALAILNLAHTHPYCLEDDPRISQEGPIISSPLMILYATWVVL